MNIDEPASISEDEIGPTIVEALGGADNIQSIDNCFSRLRLELKDTSLVDEEALRKTGAAGTNKLDETNYQVVYGVKVEGIADKVKGAINYNGE